VQIEFEPAGSMQISERQRRPDPMGDITLLIQRARAGDAHALDALFEQLYPELRRIAHLRLRRRFHDPKLGTHVTLDDELAGTDTAAEAQILRVHEALEEIADFDARLARLVEMRYFGGMSDLQIASALAITDRTVRRDWQKARLLLSAALR
jgi:DNA-directed RNA polymerase specialized sigma24 family protein